MSWEDMENVKNMENREKMENINQMTYNTKVMVQNPLLVTENTLFVNWITQNTLFTAFMVTVTDG